MIQKFRDARLSKKSKERLKLINQIINEYRNQGYVLTLRQLYYQLVSRDIIANKDAEYTKLSKLLSKARMSGLVDWSAIEDRLRKVRKSPTWESPKEILQSAASQFALDRLQDQSVHVEVWVEKDALSQVVERAAKQYQIPVLVNRGYGSVSAMYDTYKRFSSELKRGKEGVVILYLGDHDPSGLDMVRDVNDRIAEMLEYDDFREMIQVSHIALTRDQISQYNPPPNPAKLSDTRANWYVSEHGTTSWEVDALPPNVLEDLILSEIEALIDIDKYNYWKDSEDEQKKKIAALINNF